MPTLTMTRGLPASGKTTWALDQVAANPNGVKRVNKDDLRAMLDGGRWSKDAEKFVLRVRDDIVTAALEQRRHVIVDDTNLAPRHEQRLRDLAKQARAQFAVRDFTDVPVDECIRRDLLRARSVGEQVIRGMWRQFLRPVPPVYAPEPGLLPAIVVDIDGTLAHMNGRRPYDWDRVGEDQADPVVAELIRRYRPSHHVVLLSGRDGCCGEATARWVAAALDGAAVMPLDHRIHLWMRAAGDTRPDTVVKRELFETHVRRRFAVEFVVDDRPSVCRMWRDDVGVQVLQVGDPDHDF